LKIACYIVLLLCFGYFAQSQPYYFRGEVKDEAGNPVQNVSILHHSSGYVYNTGISGAFGFITPFKKDTLTFSKDGYQKTRIIADTEKYLNLRLIKSVTSATSVRRYKLASLTKDLTRENQRTWFTGDETYASILENRFVSANQFPSTSLALNVDRASYSNVRRFLNMKNKVPPDAVRIEEMLNYFNTGYSKPEGDDPFAIQSTLTMSPWSKESQLFYLNISSRKLNVDTLPPCNLVFLIDVSGSMDMPNRLPLLQSAFRMLVNNLRSKDSVSIIAYGGTVGVHLEATGGNEKEKIIKAIDELTPGGSTPGESGIRLAYKIATSHFIKEGNNRVILATDGDFNVGLKTESELEELITSHSKNGIYLTCLGVGMGNYKDSKIQTLARKGKGNFAYLDNFQEAEKVLLKEFTQTMYAVADDVYINVNFNPAYVKEYRLIGFDNKVGAISDSLSTIEGGEIGSGHTMTVAFEIMPTPFYMNEKEKSLPGQRFAEILLNYKLPNDTVKRTFQTVSPNHLIPFSQIDSQQKFSASLIMFGSLLRESSYLKQITWNDIYSIASLSHDPHDKIQKEFLTLVEIAKEVYSKKTKRKRRKEEAKN
jgi:Ca-activated chloride channel family protein